MNCKPGDLAYVTAGAQTPGLAGMFVIVLSEAPTTKHSFSGEIWVPQSHSWFCESASGVLLPAQAGGGRVHFHKVRPIADEILRPIRDKDGEDETLTWAGKPQQIKEPA